MIAVDDAIAIGELALQVGEKVAEIVRAAHAGDVTPDEAKAALAAVVDGTTGLSATLAARKAKALADLDAKFPNG